MTHTLKEWHIRTNSKIREAQFRRKCEKEFLKLSKNHDNLLFRFQNYGSDMISKKSFVQCEIIQTDSVDFGRYSKRRRK